MLSVVIGIGIVFTDGRAITGDALDPINWLAQGYIGIVPIPVVIMLVGYAIAWVILNRTRFGAHVYLTGDNREAAFRAGIAVNRIRMAVFIAAGALAGLGGVILVSRVSQSTASLGEAAGGASRTR
jgi:ribose/xylose/arabinose/galactoside ABC-type transport system permease subunit